MTTAYWAMEMREAAGDEASLVDFSYRRDGSYERALQIAWAAFICGFNSTSNLDAGDEYGLQTTGTMAHHWLQRFIKYARPENWQIDVRTGKPKHFEQIGFEKWLDAYIDEGTTCLPDAFGLVPGMRHLAMAATSTPARSAALRNIRIDSGKNAQDYAERIIYAWEVLQKTGLVHVGIIPSGDMSARMIREIKAILDQHSPAIKIPAWPIGTKLAAEVEFVVSVIFKLYQIGNEATMKLPDTRVKATLPGDIQVWRCIDLDDEDNPYYVKDIMALWNEPMPRGKDFTRAEPLLKLLWGKGADQCIRRSPQELKAFVQAQKKKFRVPLKQYPVVLSPALAALQKDTIELIDEDPNDYSVIGL